MNKSKLIVLLFLMLALMGIFSFSASAGSQDAAGTRSPDEQAFKSNRPPKANAGPDATYTDSDNDGYEELLLDGTASYDPDGSITQYEWKRGGTVIATGQNPLVSLPVGVHTITLRVRDNKGSTGVDTVVIRVEAGACTIGSMNVQGISNGQMLTGVVNVQALFSGTPTKVEFKLRGPNGSTYTHIENSAPFYFLGDTSGVPNGWNTAIYPAGSYRLTIISYEGSRPCETQVFDVTIPPPPPPQCSHITINNVIYGTSHSEVINGTPGNDLIFAGRGSDIVYGNGGDDCILGENGHDELHGNDGNDVLLGGNGSDKMRGGNHDDTLYGGNDSDSMYGDDGEDTLWGGGGSDAGFGGPGNDYINGEDGNDAPLVGNGGDDTIYGGSGHDELYGDGYNGHSGADYGDNGAPGNDKLYGESGHDELYGGPKDDVLDGGKNDDQMFGEAGNDSITGGQNSDDFWGGPDIDVALDYTKPPDGICNAIEFGCPGSPPPTAPTANPDTYGVAAGSTIPLGAFNVLSNDTGGPPPAVVSFGGPAAGNAGDNPAGTSAPADALGGILTLNANGTFTYDATAAVVGTATYYYVIQNPVGSATGQITIIVGTAPTAKPDTFLTPPNTTLNVPAGGLFADNGSGADDPGSPAATIVSFGGGTLGGSVTDNAAGTTVNSGGHILKVNADGSFDYTPAPAFSGDFTFQYRLQNIIGFSDTTVTVKTQSPPVAVNDGVYKVLAGGTLTVATSDPNDLLDNDNLGIPAATLTSFGGGSLGGAVTDNAAGASVALAGGTLTVNADGSFSLATPTTPGSYTFEYRLTNIAGTSDATVTIEVQQAPDAKDDSFIVAVGVALNGDLTADNGSGADNPGFPAATLSSFGGGSLGGTVTDNAAGASVALAGGTLTVNADGTFSLTGTTATGIFTFQYRLSNAIPASDDATVTIEIRQSPVAVNDGVYKVLAGGTLTVATSDPNDLLDNDTLGFPAATLTSFGGGDLGGTVTSNAAGASVGLAGGTLTVNADGSFSLATPTTPGSYTFQYRLTNTAGTSDATVTIEVQQAPVANDDSFIVSVGAAFNGDLTADNGSGADNPGFPAFNQLQFGGGDLGGSVTDNTAPDSVLLAGGTLTVNADGTFSLTGTTATGTFTFQYRLSNAIPASDDATVTIEIRQSPTAVDDGTYTVATGSTLTITTSDPNDLLDNDTLGSPAATLTSFGGGSLGGAVTDNAAGASVGLAGGTLMVNADGSFSLATPTTPGSYTFQYRLTNAAGTDDATVTIEVQQAPIANDDSFIVAVGVALNGDLTADNGSGADNPGFPAFNQLQFGGGDLGGSVTDNTAPDSVLLAGGTLTVNADGTFSLTGTTATGIFTFQYRLSNAIPASDDATVTIEIRKAPTANDDGAYTVLAGGTLTITTSDPNDLLDNDDLGFPAATLTSFGGGSLGGTVTSNAAGASVSFAGGTLTVNADGSFSLATPTTPGSYTFQYRLTNAAGTDDATVTIEVRQVPTANDDGTYTVATGGTLTIVTSDPNDLLDNDNLGFPAAAITHFGGGSMGGTVTDNAAGTTVSPLPSQTDGSLTVNANGSFTFTSPTGYCGNFTFQYRLTNAAGSDDATVTINVLCLPPDAVDDSVAGNSAPGNNYHTALNTPLAIADGSGQDLDANDDLGIPPGAIVSFGAIQTVVQSGGSAGTFNAAVGTVTTNAAGATVSPIPGFSDGLLTVNANGSLSFTPPTNYTGLFRFQYRLQNVVGSDDATVTLAVGVRPNAVNDTYTSTLVGNIHIDTTVSSNFSVLTNDSGDMIDVGLVSSPNGNMTFNPNGTFTFNPAAGFEGSASVTYNITNGFGAVNGTLTLPVSGMIWFINAGAGGGGDGRFNSPFNCLVGAGCFSAVAADDPGDNIFLYEHATSYTAGLTLLNNQRLIGQDATAALSAITGLTPPADSPSLPVMNSANATRVTLTNASGNGVALGQNNAVHGLTIGNTSGTDLAGANFGTLTVDDVLLNGTGRILSLTTGTCNCQFDGLSTTSNAAHGILLDGVGGTLSSPSTSVSGTTGVGIQVQNSGGSRDFGSTNVSMAAAQTGVFLNNNTGTNTFSRLSITTANSSALVGTNNTGGITVTNATGSVLFVMMGAAVDITTASGTTPINLNFSSITTDNSPQYGIRLDTVSGTGMNVTGAVTLDMVPGALENMLLRNSTATTLSFAAASTVAINERRATGILIDNVDGGTVQFGSTTINNPNITARAAVRGIDSSSTVTFASLNINQGAAGTGEQFQAGDANLPDDTTPAGNGDGVYLNNMSGLVTFNGGTIQNVADDGIDIRSSSGLTLNNVTIDGFNTNKSNGQAGIQATNVTGTHTLNTVTVQNFDLDPAAAALCGGVEPCNNGNLVVVRATTGTSTFDVNNGTFEGRAGGGNNSIRGTGLRVFQTSTANVTLDISGATIRDVWSFGVLFQASAGSGSSTLNVQNTLFTGTGPAGLNALELFTQGSAGHTASFNITGNTFTDIAQASGTAIRLNLNDNTSATSVSNAVNANTLTQTGTPLLTGIGFEIGENVSVRSTVNNNTITGIQDNALSFFSDLNWTGTANLTVIDNIFGTVASPVGQAGGAASGQAVLIRGQNTGTINLLMDNTVSGKSIVNTTHPRRTVDIRSEGTGRVNATVTDLVMTNTGSSTMVFLAATTVATSTMCTDLQTSSANSGAGTFTLSNAGVAANYLWDNASAGTNSGTVSPPAPFTASATCPLP